MFDTTILLIVGLLLIVSTILSFGVLKEVWRSYSGSVKLEQVGVTVINSVLLLMIVCILIERHVRIV